MPTLHIRKQTINQNAYQYTRVQDRNTGMALTAYLMSRLLFLLHAFISFHFLSCLCVCYYICLYFGKAAFHGCPIKCLSLSFWVCVEGHPWGWKLSEFHIDPLLGRSICNALWPKSKPVVHPTLYLTQISFIPSRSTFPFLKNMLLKIWPW